MPEQLADIVRQKYPGQYDDLDDQTLEDNILKKYPQYSDLTGPNRNAPPAALKVDNPDVDQRIKEAKDFLNKRSIPEEGLPDYGTRENGSRKGRGFLGTFKIPGGSVASEYSIADSEKLKDAKGNYEDYPTLVPGLTKEELSHTLNAIATKGPLLDSVKQKAEQHAIQRRFEGKSLFAEPGSEDESNLEHDEKGQVINPSTPKKSTLESAAEDIGNFVTKHPRLQEALTGTSPEFERMKKEQGITDVQGPGFMRIPGLSEENIRKAAEYVTGSTGNARLAAGAITKALGDIAATGFDPRAMGAPRAGRAISEAAGGPVIFDFPDAIDITPGGAETPVREPVRTPIAKIGGEVAEPSNLPVRRSTEIPYRAPEDSFTAGATQTQDVAPPIVPERGMEQPENLVPAPAKEPTPGMTEDQLFQQAVEKFNMGRPLPEPSAEEQPATKYGSSFINPQGWEEFGPPESDLPVREPINQAITARHIGTQPAYQDIPEQDLFNVEGGPEHGSTLTRQGLEDRGIEVPERNPELAGKTGDQLRAEALAKRKLPFDNPFERAPEQTDIEPSFSRNFQSDDLFKGSRGEGLSENKSFEDQWAEATNEAEKVGLDTKGYDNLDQLQWDITRKAAQMTQQTGTNPLKSEDEPQFARTESGGVRMDIGDRKAMIDIFKNTYSGSVPHVAAKELIQNAIDAAAERGGEGQVSVSSSAKNHTITVADNGKGLNRNEIDTVFTNLSSSGKRGGSTKTIGELGVGKTTYLVAGEHVSVHTVHQDPETGKKILITFNGTPHEIVEGVHPREQEVEDDTPTGTTVVLEVPRGSNYHSMVQYFDNLKKYSNTPVRIDINHEGEQSYYNKSMNIPAKTESGGKVIGKGLAKTSDGKPSSKFKLTIPDDAIWSENERIALILNNRGMFQGVDSHYLPGKAEVPDRIVVDLDPQVPGTDGAYPLTAPTREKLKNDVRYNIGRMIDKDLVEALLEKRKKELTRIFEKLVDSKGMTVYNGGERYTPEELKNIQTSTSMHKLYNIISDMIEELHGIFPTGHMYGDERVGQVKIRATGFIFDDLRGVNIKNPSSDNEIAILVNPFSEISTYFDKPKLAAQGIVHIILHEFTHAHVRNEGADFTAKLATIHAEFPLEKQLAARDAIVKAISEKRGFDVFNRDYNPEIEKLLYEYTESRGRTKSGTDVLLREAGSYVFRSEESKGSSGRDKQAGAGTPTQSAVRKLLAALEEAHSANDEQAASIRQERAKRFAEFEGVKAKGRKGAAQSLSKLRGEYEKEDFSSTLGDSLKEKDVDALFTAVKLANITPAEKARGYTALFKLLNGVLPPRSDLKVLGDVFGGGFSNRVVEMHGGLGGVPIKLTKVANSMKALRSSLDISAPLRQGLGLIHRGEWWSALGDAFTFLANKDAYEYAMHMIQKDPYYLVGREAGLFLAKPDDMIEGEETFMNSYVHNIPKWTGIPKLVDASERAYTGFLNELRFKTFKNLVQLAKEAGHETFTLEKAAEDAPIHIATTKLTDDIAKMINISTGRGSLGRFEKIAAEINAVIWSPKFLSSRLTMLNPKYYHDLDKFARWEAIKSLFAIAGFGIGVTSIGALMGGKSLGNPLSGYLQSDPHQFGNMNWLSGQNPQILSTDFAKTRFGQNVVDPWGGFQQPIVATARFLTGEANGRPQARTTTLGNFTANKLSPMAALAFEIGSAKQFTGKGQFVDAYGQKKYLPAEIANSFVPMFVQDVRDVFQTDAPFAEQLGLDTASLFGMGIQQYPEANTQKNKLKFRKMTLSR